MTKIVWTETWNAPAYKIENGIWLYDRILKAKLKKHKHSSIVESCLKKGIALQAGESLKTLAQYEATLIGLTAKLQKMGISRPTLVACGGGSVGDFCGFIASTYRRGIPYINIPSTWLAALDSSHGGKNGLNLGGLKNQIGTFYLPSKVIINRSLLLNQPQARAHEGFPELLKIFLLCAGARERSFFTANSNSECVDGNFIWQHLPQAITFKNRIVASDPFEQNGRRRVLNFGHTMGHAFEASFKMPHGYAVYLGMEFALRWGLQKKLTSATTLDSLAKMNLSSFFRPPTSELEYRTHLKKILTKLPRLLSGDKKGDGNNRINFIFLKTIGLPYQDSVSIQEIVREAKRQSTSLQKDGILLGT